MRKIVSTSIIVLIIDQLLKLVIKLNLKELESIVIIPKFFSITLAYNSGAAWSILANERFFLIIISIIFLTLIYYYIKNNESVNKYESIGYGVLIGGILGNLIDRITLGYVVDYLSFNIFNYNYPIFNFADICIVVSIFFLVLGEVIGWKSK